MEIGFDAKRLFNNFTGLGNYSRFVVQALLEFEKDASLVLYSPKTTTWEHPDVKPIVTAPQVEVVTPPGFYRWTKTTSLWRSFGIGHEPSAQRLNVFHGLSQELPDGLPSGVRKVVTVHDLIFLRFPELYSRIDKYIYTQKVKKSCNDADTVVCISQQTAQDVMTFLRTPEEKIKIVYQGTHPQFTQRVSNETKEAVRSKWKLPPAYILTVGTVEPRKNMLAAVRALAMLPKEQRLPLVIVGRETAYKSTVAQEARVLGVSSEVIFLHKVPFADLPALYQGCSLFVYPSLFEGFGIPIVEALQSRVPVISSTGSCFSEAGGPNSLYAEPGNPAELAAQMLRVLGDPALQNTMIEKGQRYAERFAPRQIASDLMEVYRG